MLLIATVAAGGQDGNIDPQIRNRNTAEQRVTGIELSPRFVTTIRVPEPVNAVVVGDPALFQVEHSEREPKLVFVKPLTTDDAESNLLISTTTGRQISLLLISHGRRTTHMPVDFVFAYTWPGEFLLDSTSIPFALVAQTGNVSSSPQSADETTLNPIPTGIAARSDATPSAQPKPDALDDLLARQMRQPLPAMNRGQAFASKPREEPLQAGIGEVLDDGQQVIALFSVINAGDRAVLLMAPQVQLGGRHSSGKIVRQERWSAAEQLPVLNFRLSRRRIGPGERADGVVVFRRPPYKQSNESLFLQIADSGAVDKPALVPIGFGVSTSQQGVNHVQ
jgi:type IV secretory pathway VirB9-like protein